jgi:hypothetical protein
MGHSAHKLAKLGRDTGFGPPPKGLAKYENFRNYENVNNGLPMVPILSQTNPTYMTYYFSNVHPNFIFFPVPFPLAFPFPFFSTHATQNYKVKLR